MSAGVFGFVEILANGLPRYRPVLTGVIITDVHIMSWSVQRNSVWSETGYAMMLGGFEK